MKYLMLMLCLLVVMVTVWTEVAGSEVTSVTFNKSEKFVTTSSYVYHMELDLYKNDGSILFSTHRYLQTTDGETTSTVGTISVSSITGFKQLNSTHVVLVDHRQQCIKMLNRNSNDLQTFAGTCGTRGYANGRVGTGKLHFPYRIEVDVRNPGMLIVTDDFNHALRSVDLQTGVLGTILKSSGIIHPRGMLWVNNRLLVTNYNCISEVSWGINGTVTHTRIAGSTSRGGTDGSFSVSKFSNPHELIEVGDRLILVADLNNYKLRLMNMNTGRVGPVCFHGESPCTTGSTLSSAPYSFLKVGNYIYVGMSRGIYKLSGSDVPARAVCPYNNITEYVLPSKESAAVRLHCGNTAVLPPGNYQLEKEHNSSTCSYHVHVLVSPVIRTLVFKAEYEVNCSFLDDSLTAEVLHSVLRQRGNQLQRICGQECAMSTLQLPWHVCDENLLTVYWPMDQVFPVDVSTPPSALTALLKGRLREHPDICAEIFILSRKNAFVPARRNAEGENVQIVLNSRCTDRLKRYDDNQDTCM